MCNYKVKNKTGKTVIIVLETNERKSTELSLIEECNIIISVQRYIVIKVVPLLAYLDVYRHLQFVHYYNISHRYAVYTYYWGWGRVGGGQVF